MSRLDNHFLVSTSVPGLLIDLEPRESHEALKSQSATVADLKVAVGRDLEWLLNTRCFAENEDGGLKEALNSVAFYGLPDFTAVSAKNPHEQTRMKRAIETALANFEPRFSGVRVTMEPISSVDRLLKFRIEAMLEIEPNPEPVVFDTVLQLGTGSFAVSNV